MPNYVTTPSGQMVDLEKLSQSDLHALFHQVNVMQQVAQNADPQIIDALRQRSDGYRHAANLIEGAGKDMKDAYDQGWWDAAKARGISLLEVFKGQADTAAAAAEYIDPVDGKILKDTWKLSTALGGSVGEHMAGHDVKATWKGATAIVPELVPDDLKNPLKASIKLHEAGYEALQGEGEKAAVAAAKAAGYLAKDTLIGPAADMYEGQKLSQQGVQHFYETGRQMDEINDSAARHMAKNQEVADQVSAKADLTGDMANYMERGKDPAWNDVLDKIKQQAPGIEVDQDAVQRDAATRRDFVLDQAHRAKLPADVLDAYKIHADTGKAPDAPDTTQLVHAPEEGKTSASLPVGVAEPTGPGVPVDHTPTEEKHPEITGPEFDELNKRDQRALNHIADEKFYAEHPELAGKPIPADAPQELKDEWLKHRQDALEQSWQNTAVDKAYHEHYEKLGVTPPDKIDPNDPDHAEFQKTWQNLKENLTEGQGGGLGAEAAALQEQLAHLIADTEQKLGQLKGTAEAALARTSQFATEASEAAGHAKEDFTQADTLVGQTLPGMLESLAAQETASEKHMQGAGESAAHAKSSGEAAGHLDDQAKQGAEHAAGFETAAQEHVALAAMHETQAADHAEKSAGHQESAQAHAAAAAQAEAAAQKHAEEAAANEAAATDHAAKAAALAETAHGHADQAQASENAAQQHDTAAKGQADKARESATQAGVSDEAAANSEQSAGHEAAASVEHEHTAAQALTETLRSAEQAHDVAEVAAAHATAADAAEHEAEGHSTHATTYADAAQAHATAAAEQEGLSHQHADAAGTTEGEARNHASQADTQTHAALAHSQAAAEQMGIASQHAEHAAESDQTAQDHAAKAAQALHQVTDLAASADEFVGNAQTMAESAAAADQQAAQADTETQAMVDQIIQANAQAEEYQQAAAQSAEDAATQSQEAAGHTEKNTESVNLAQAAIEATTDQASKAAGFQVKAEEAEHLAQDHLHKVQDSHTAAVASARTAAEEAAHAAEREQFADSAAQTTDANLGTAKEAEGQAADSQQTAEDHAHTTSDLADACQDHNRTVEQLFQQSQTQLQQLTSLIEQGQMMLDAIQTAQREAFDAVEIARVRRQMRAIQQSISSLGE
jgi:hypothetical protein